MTGCTYILGSKRRRRGVHAKPTLRDPVGHSAQPCRAPLSAGRSRREYWSVLLCPRGLVPLQGSNPSLLGTEGRVGTVSCLRRGHFRSRSWQLSGVGCRAAGGRRPAEHRAARSGTLPSGGRPPLPAPLAWPRPPPSCSASVSSTSAGFADKRSRTLLV